MEVCYFGAPRYGHHGGIQGSKLTTIALHTRSSHGSTHRKGWHHPGPVHRSSRRISKASCGRRVHSTSGRRRTRTKLTFGFERNIIVQERCHATIPTVWVQARTGKICWFLSTLSRLASPETLGHKTGLCSKQTRPSTVD
ncbi:hypothetical protein K0M31_011182 [Melipona bicolor]|uniref:Uncharacterized protein n=1 Tax=Melipona bicolor TaxID=60889 RepID=A0AA40G991_9HYME|nr:hypothetical protein K0M31_011182 [Melipona bicolor]